MSTQSKQYNQVQRPYDEFSKSTTALLMRVNVRRTALPFVKDAAVLDLACGTGFYSRSFLTWGAKSVVGVDISSGMLQEARALSPSGSDSSSSITYLEADCSKPTTFPGGPFDVVFGGWLLNYAPTLESMVDFYRNISLNLKPYGLFIGVTPSPTDDPAAHLEREASLRPPPIASGGMFSHATGKVKDGVAVHRHSDTAAGKLDFDTYHLEKRVFEAAADAAGFTHVEWLATSIPSDFMEHPERYGEAENGGAGAEELATYAELPFYGLLEVRK